MCAVHGHSWQCGAALDILGTCGLSKGVRTRTRLLGLACGLGAQQAGCMLVLGIHRT